MALLAWLRWIAGPGSYQLKHRRAVVREDAKTSWAEPGKQRTPPTESVARGGGSSQRSRSKSDVPTHGSRNSRHRRAQPAEPAIAYALRPSEAPPCGPPHRAHRRHHGGEHQHDKSSTSAHSSRRAARKSLDTLPLRQPRFTRKPPVYEDAQPLVERQQSSFTSALPATNAVSGTTKPDPMLSIFSRQPSRPTAPRPLATRQQGTAIPVPAAPASAAYFAPNAVPTRGLSATGQTGAFASFAKGM